MDEFIKNSLNAGNNLSVKYPRIETSIWECRGSSLKLHYCAEYGYRFKNFNKTGKKQLSKNQIKNSNNKKQKQKQKQKNEKDKEKEKKQTKQQQQQQKK